MPQAENRPPSISVIVPVHNGGAAFRRCLRALMASSDSPDELIVASDGGVDGSDRFASSLGAQVVPTARPASGPAAARNLAARHATGDVLLFIDADVLVKPSTVGEVRRFFASNPDVAAVMGNYDRRPAARNFLSVYKNLLQHYVHANASAETFTFWGAVGGVRREAFEAVGGFDARRYPHPCIEDIELGGRLAAAGYRLRLEKDIEVKHLKRWTFASLLKSDFLRRAIPWTELILETGGMRDDLNIDRAARAKVLLSGAAAFGWLVALAFGAPGWVAACVSVASLLLIGVLDAPMLRWFAHERGARFSLRVFAWQTFSYFYSGVAFAVGAARHLRKRLLARERQGAPQVGAAF